MNLYFLPTSEQGLGNRLFTVPKKFLYEGGVSNSPFWRRFWEAGQRNGIHVMTSDAWSRENRSDDDVLVVQNHPGETWPWRMFYRVKQWKMWGGFVLSRRRFLLKNYRFFKRRVLLQTESPMIMPYIYNNLPKIRNSGIYDKMYLLSRGKPDDGYFNYYDYRERSIESPYFTAPKDKFLVMVKANMTLHSLKGELYGERLKAIRHFSAVPGFDLYGYDWNKMPRHPFHFYAGSRVRSAWRGVAPDKMKTVSQYKFMLCFENCSYPGYVSEKIYDCLASGSIPIYLGAPDIADFVPPSCFIDSRRFRTYSELHAFLEKLGEADLQKYRNAMLTFMRDKNTLKKLDDFIREITFQAKTNG